MLQRKYRWLFSAEFPGGKVKELSVKVEKRPSLEIVEKENSDGSYRIEKHSWAPLVTTFYAVSDSSLEPIYEILAKFYDFGAELFKTADPKGQLEGIEGHLGTGKIVMMDACGNPLEEWGLQGLWPHSVNFGDLCYSDSDEIDIEITWRFKGCTYRNLLTPTT